eukprot:SAG22_NODE_1296_length_4822_cov_3.066271_5_plen_71_part_00
MFLEPQGAAGAADERDGAGLKVLASRPRLGFACRWRWRRLATTGIVARPQVAGAQRKADWADSGSRRVIV